MFIRTVNKCHTHTKSTLRPVLTRPHPSSAQLEVSQGCQGPRAAWPGSRAGRAGKGCVKAGGLGALTPVQRPQEPLAEVGPPDGPSTGLSLEFIDVRPSQATLALRASLDKDGGAWSISVQPRLPSLEPPQRPARAGS